jgi:hypothetical protein
MKSGCQQASAGEAESDDETYELNIAVLML